MNPTALIFSIVALLGFMCNSVEAQRSDCPKNCTINNPVDDENCIKPFVKAITIAKDNTTMSSSNTRNVVISGLPNHTITKALFNGFFYYFTIVFHRLIVTGEVKILVYQKFNATAYNVMNTVNFPVKNVNGLVDIDPKSFNITTKIESYTTSGIPTFLKPQIEAFASEECANQIIAVTNQILDNCTYTTTFPIGP